MKNLISILLILVFSISLYSQDMKVKKNSNSWYIPTNIKMQYAGNMGLFSIGVGYSFFNKRFETALFYGYLPESVGGVTVNTIALRGYWHSKKVTFGSKLYWEVINIGLGIQYAIGEYYFVKQPERYPNKYYKQTAIRLTPIVGTTIKYRINNFLFKNIGFYCELGTVDYYLRDYFRSKFEENWLDIDDIVNISFGISGEFS